MLRKLFHGGAGATARAPSEAAQYAEGDASDGRFDDWIGRLDLFDEGLKSTLSSLTRHTLAISELCSSAMDLSSKLNDAYGDDERVQQQRHPHRQLYCGDSAALLDDFRRTVLAPLQALHSCIPPLRVRCEHRQSALKQMLRYQQKVEDLEKSSKSETTRLQRNRAKLQAAAVRYRELDVGLRTDIRALVSRDLRAMTRSATATLLLEAQLVAAKEVTQSSHQLRDLLLGDGKSPESKPRNDDDDKSKQNAVTDTTEAESNNALVEPSLLSAPADPATATLRAIAATTSPMPSLHDTSATITATRKKHVHGTRTWDIHQRIKGSMTAGLDLAECVRLPEGLGVDEWVAVHVVDFYNEIHLLHGIIAEVCTPQSCPKMSAGPCYTYMWADGQRQVTPVSLPAPEYIARLLAWIAGQLGDERVFPSGDAAAAYAPDFLPRVASPILRRLFRVYAHMYHSHLPDFAELGADGHLGFCFRRFVRFVTEFALVEPKELNALRKLVHGLLEGPAGEDCGC